MQLFTHERKCFLSCYIIREFKGLDPFFSPKWDAMKAVYWCRRASQYHDLLTKIKVKVMLISQNRTEDLLVAHNKIVFLLVTFSQKQPISMNFRSYCWQNLHEKYMSFFFVAFCCKILRIFFFFACWQFF